MRAAVASSHSLLCEESISVGDRDDAAAIFGLDRLAMSAVRGEDPRRDDQPCQVDCALQFGECMALLMGQERVGRYLPCKLFVRKLLHERSSLSAVLELRRATVLWTLELQRVLCLDISVAGSAVSMLDRFISSSCNSSQLQLRESLPTVFGQLDMKLVGVACLWLAAKYSGGRELDFWRLQAAAMIEYDAASLRRMELLVLRTLGWSAITLTPHDFIFNAIQLLTATKTFPQHTLDYFLSRADELAAGLLPEAAFLQFQPSVISTCILQCVLDESIPLHSGDFMDSFRTTLAVDMISAWDCYQLLMDCVVDPADCYCAAPSPDHVADVHFTLPERNK